jgi:predicted ABC-type transport system involved in lysophospholipase L1 biosynthesis ATPase subunit
MTGGAVALEMERVSKSYSGLRPLRITALSVRSGERVSIGGIDAAAGELLVNLVTGASLPDAGEIRVFGRSTREIADGDEWLESLDRFGIVSPRAVLLEGSTLLQNLAIPFTLEIDPVPEGVRARVESLARRCGVDAPRWLHARAGELPADVRVRAHLARALAPGPALLIVEHPTAEVEGGARTQLAADIMRACEEMTATALILTNDDEFARIVAPRNLKLHGATGELKPLRKGLFR